MRGNMRSGAGSLQRQVRHAFPAGTGRHYEVFAMAALERSETTLRMISQVSRWYCSGMLILSPSWNRARFPAFDS